MHLTLRYQETAQRPACATLLRGDAAAWLREIGRWNLTAGQLSCYLVPESIRSVQPAGLFVIVKDGSPLPPDLLEPYGAVAGRLYVPVQATLWPATTAAELAGALLWPRQLLHPAIGLVGFDSTDEIDLTSLLDCAAPRLTDWSRAQPGLAPKPRLERVRVLAPTVAEVVESFQQEIGTVPLTALPGAADARPNLLKRALDSVRRGLLKFFLALLQWGPAPVLGQAGRAIGAVLLAVLGIVLVVGLLGRMGSGGGGGLIVPLTILLVRLLMRAKNNAGSGSRPPATNRPVSSQPGVFQRLENWLGGRIHDLEQNRQNEIERLLRLFGDNMDEALKYAIPLNSPYMNRGEAPQSAWLGRRLTDFNLGGLGGGSRVDAWDLGAYRHNLGLQYRAAATREVEAGRFKKAAYIYAHLLGDYQAAANALDQGGFCREAAALFKDHLHNLPAAAKCLENGGLLLEAAELYAELKEHEKAGDLHQRLEQPVLAARHYERGVNLFLDNDDHPAAARLLADKLAARARAQEVLLQGWASPKQPEVCLRQYFDVLAAAPEADLRPHVQNIYRNHTAVGRRVPLLHVLATVNEKHATPELRAATLEIAYEVVSAEAEAGNASPLALLRNFLPDDRLIAADCSRYATRQPRPAASVSNPSVQGVSAQLDATIEWISAVTHGHQWVAIGTRDDRLHLARGNWYGNVEYYSWLADMNGVYVLLIADERHGNRMLLRTSAALALETKYLPKNKHFPIALTVECPAWLPRWPVRVALLPSGVTAAAWREGTTITVQRYLAGGQPLAPFINELMAPISAEAEEWPAELLFRDGDYYSYWGDTLVQWAEGGRSRLHRIEEGASGFQLAASPYTPKLQLAVFTQFDLLLWEPQQRISNEPLSVYSPNFMVTGDMKFVSAEHLVLLDDSTAELLQMHENRYEQVRSIELENTPVAVLPTINRQQFALLESTGRISLHLINNG
ncbi:hypothetical protein Q5H92_13070 [Hymenobacter sp. M29]|uniref:MoxR-vWA-beta-propeller ternary system domain-containing protein n=1 Tax=Hymenobacter mellowenesis TaxID=3063995 RepID=A0ABT9AF42_9BACT|nr:hypothetical protein [Hymenobacter sp. M29]MDO7847297.1 hypothetical protein [Hymenobacter sp. M29]